MAFSRLDLTVLPRRSLEDREGLGLDVVAGARLTMLVLPDLRQAGQFDLGAAEGDGVDRRGSRIDVT
jgi:hypothetical protein